MGNVKGGLGKELRAARKRPRGRPKRRFKDAEDDVS